MNYTAEAIIWLATQLDRMPISTEVSLWNAIRQEEAPQHRFANDETLRVYITGEPEVVYGQTDLFHTIPSKTQPIDVFEQNPTHRLKEWLAITYVPPQAVDVNSPYNVTLFVKDRLPRWSRELLLAQKICRVVSTVPIRTLERFNDVHQVVLTDFDYEQLMMDMLPASPKKNRTTAPQLYPTVPKHHTLKLLNSNSGQQEESHLILDSIAVDMLNIYWLQNRPVISDWMPYLLREIDAFLMIKQQHGHDLNNIIQKLERWGARDKLN